MTCRQVDFAQGNCLLEIDVESQLQPGFTACMSVVEEGGQIVRPIVGADGHRVELHAGSERLVYDSAVQFLERRFGSVGRNTACLNLATAAIGRPVVMTD